MYHLLLSAQVNVSTETSLLPSIEPLDVRYKLGVWTLELMQEEEQRLQEELSKQPLKVHFSYSEDTDLISILFKFWLTILPLYLPHRSFLSQSLQNQPW